jgi:hypothetical protein
MTHTPVTLSDPNTAQVHKVATYCLSKLQEQNIHMDLSPKYIRRPVYQSEEEAEPVPSGRPVLELLCNGMVCVMELIVVMHHTCASYHGLNLICIKCILSNLHHFGSNGRQSRGQTASLWKRYMHVPTVSSFSSMLLLCCRRLCLSK